MYTYGGDLCTMDKAEQREAHSEQHLMTWNIWEMRRLDLEMQKKSLERQLNVSPPFDEYLLLSARVMEIYKRLSDIAKEQESLLLLSTQ